MKTFSQQHQDSAQARSVLRYGALVAPISMMLYGLMVQAETLPVVHSSLQPAPELIIVLSIAWLMLGAVTFLTQQSKLWFITAMEVGAYFFMAMIQTWFISGIASPFAAYWILLLLATFIFFGRVGLRTGILLFILTMAVDVMVLGANDPTWAIISVMTAIAVLVTCLIIVTVYASQCASNQELIASHIREGNERDRIITLINNITDAVFSTDKYGVVKIYNSAALNLLDTNAEIGNRHISELIQLETSTGKPIDVFDELSKNSTIRQRDDLVMQLGGDDQLRIEATFAPVQGSDSKAGEPDSYVLILRDVTLMKSLEEERDEFISVVSHELRTPVTIAEGSLSNAELLSKKGHASKVQDAIKEAHKQILFLARMVNDLSTLSRAEQGTSDRAEVIDVIELAHQTHGEYAPQAEEKGLGFNLDLIGKPGEVYASRLYLQELLQNFITNAIRYTPAGSVTLRIERQGEKINFEVIDTGIGIGKADQKKIFERFYRAEDYRTRETSGTGLGLYVAAKLARKLGCKIEVDSRLNHGSTFKFSLDVYKKSEN